MKDLSQLLFLSCWGLASATWLRSCDIQSGEGMIIAQLNELSFGMPLICLRTSMYVQEGTRFRNGSQWYLNIYMPFMPVAVCYFYVWSSCKKSLAPRFGARRQRRKRRRSACGTSHSVLDPTSGLLLRGDPMIQSMGPKMVLIKKGDGIFNRVAGLYLINIYSAIIVVIILSLYVQICITKHLARETERETNMCFFQSLRTSKYPERSTWCHSTTWGADQEIAVWSGRSQGGLSFRRLRSGRAWDLTPHFLGMETMGVGM